MVGDEYDPWANVPDWGGITEEEFRAKRAQLSGWGPSNWKAEEAARKAKWALQEDIVGRLGYDGRARAICEDRKAGNTFVALGEKYGLTPERVRQIVLKEGPRNKRKQKGEVG